MIPLYIVQQQQNCIFIVAQHPQQDHQHKFNNTTQQIQHMIR